MRTQHLELMVEEPSMEAFLRAVLPGLLGPETTFEVYPFQGKDDLLHKLPQRLQGYTKWLPPSTRVFVIVDRDDDGCHELKALLENIASRSGLRSRSRASKKRWQVVNRIAIEELEAWYFGDWQAVIESYPGVSRTVPSKAQYRNPDAVRGGTKEAFERVLKRAGHFVTGLRTVEAARAIGTRFVPERSTSHSFQKLHQAVLESIA